MRARTTPAIARQIFAVRFLQSNPNLYMEIKADPASPGKNYPMADGKIKPDWLKLYQDFPDRFIIGSDQHYGPNSTLNLPRAQATVLFSTNFPPACEKK